MNRADRPKTCYYAISCPGIHVVYVTPGCPHGEMIKGTLVCSPDDCRSCLHYYRANDQEKQLRDNIARGGTRIDGLDQIKKVQCAECEYSGTAGSAITCDYVIITGSVRPCTITECKDAGIYRKRKTEKVRGRGKDIAVKCW